MSLRKSLWILLVGGALTVGAAVTPGVSAAEARTLLDSVACTLFDSCNETCQDVEFCHTYAKCDGANCIFTVQPGLCGA